MAGSISLMFGDVIRSDMTLVKGRDPFPHPSAPGRNEIQACNACLRPEARDGVVV